MNNTPQDQYNQYECDLVCHKIYTDYDCDLCKSSILKETLRISDTQICTKCLPENLNHLITPFGSDAGVSE